MMDLQKIFNEPAIKEVEVTILKMQWELEAKFGIREDYTVIINKMLLLRKRLLDREFVMDEGAKKLLGEFNEALGKALLKMRDEGTKTLKAVKAAGVPGDMWVDGKCYLGYDFPKIHPLQTPRAKKMWYMLNGTLDGKYNTYYEDGVDGVTWSLHDGERETTDDDVLYHGEPRMNWNRWFFFADNDKDGLTDDMHLIEQVHHLLEFSAFSIFDILWVRDFCVEITLETDYDSYKDGMDGVDVDWEKLDFYD